MIFLEDYNETIGKTVKKVREYVDRSFDDEAVFTLMIFTDDSALLIIHQAYFTTHSGVIKPTSNLLDKNAKKALGL